MRAAYLFLLLALPGVSEQIPLTVAEPAGVARTNDFVTSGVPFPQRALLSGDQLRLMNSSSKEVPMQVQVTGTWPDGSVKWALLDFQASLKASEEQKFTLEYGKGVERASAEGVKFQDEAEFLWVSTGPLKFSISKKEFGIFNSVKLDANKDEEFTENEELSSRALSQEVKLGKEFGELNPRVLPPEEVVVEESGPLRAVVKISGWIDNGAGEKLIQYLVRLHCYAGSSKVQIYHTAVQMHPKIKMLWVEDFSLTYQPRLGTSATYLLAGEPEIYAGSLSEAATLAQLEEGRYTFGTKTGFKAPGWVELTDGEKGVFISTRFFWQQFPKSMKVGPDGVRIGLYPAEAEKPFDMDQGLAKTYELLFDFHDGNFNPSAAHATALQRDQPLFAIAPAKWYCDSEAFGDLTPFDFDAFPDYETLTEQSADMYVRKMATGLRNWGDLYYGGEYKGTNSYMNLEYDVHHNFYGQFARTGLRKYLDTAETMAKHQADIDINHYTKWQWKHSPRHVEIQAEFGHTFTRGLVETYYLRGNKRCLEAAITLGDYFIKQIQNPRELGNERQIGWSLISLLPVYEATWDKKYFIAASNTVERLLAGLDEKGKFKIRWDNRIAFFNGIAATGFIYYYRATGDRRIAEAALKVIRRAQGMYPEYAGRTLEAIAWAYEQTGEAEWLDMLANTYETTMARAITWNALELGAPTIFTVHALPFMRQAGFVKAPSRSLNLTPQQFASENGGYAKHLPNSSGEIYLQNDSKAPLNLAIIRKGAWKGPGQALLYGPDGAIIRKLEFPKEITVWQRNILEFQELPLGTYRLTMEAPYVENERGGSQITWDVASSRRLKGLLQSAGNRHLDFVTPSLFTQARPDTGKIEIELSAQGEGFKKAVLYDPAGKVAANTENFIDLGDKKKYYYKISAKVPPEYAGKLWQLRLEEADVVKITGLLPYFSATRDNYFQPEKPLNN